MDERLLLLRSRRGALLVGIAALCGLVIGAHVATARILDTTGYGAPWGARWWTPRDLAAVTSSIGRVDAIEVLGGWLVGLIAAVLFAAAATALSLSLLRRARALDTYGTARWANRDDIVAAGLLDGRTNGQSLIVGGWRAPGARPTVRPEFLTHTGPESIAFYAPSRSGKTVGAVVPNLLCYESSVFVLDIKGELWRQTAGYRKTVLEQQVLFHDPGLDPERPVTRRVPGDAQRDSDTDPLEQGGATSACFNPLAEIDISGRASVKDVQMLMEYLIPTNGKEDGSSTTHFNASARNLAVGAFLYEMALAAGRGEHATIPAVLSAMTSAEVAFRPYLELMRTFAKGQPDVCRVIREIASEMGQREDREFSGVFSSMMTPLSIFRDPILAHATSRSDFRISDLVAGERPCSLYLTIRPSDRDRLKNYFGLIVNLICRKLTDSLPTRSSRRHELCLMLDEFSSLPALPVVQQSMDVMPGYGIKAFIVLQDYDTLQALYGQHETISSNCRIQVAYTPSKPKTAKFLSELTGSATVRQETTSAQRKPLSPVSSSHTDAEGFHQRALLTPDEVMRIGTVGVDEHYRMIRPGEALIFARGCYPIRGVQTPFFLDPDLAERAAHPPPPDSDKPNRRRGPVTSAPAVESSATAPDPDTERRERDVEAALARFGLGASGAGADRPDATDVDAGATTGSAPDTSQRQAADSDA